MKTLSKATTWQRLFLGATILVSCAPVLRAQQSPVGQPWDFVLSGSQRGVAQITFLGDFTLNGIEVITVRPISTGETTDDDERGGSGDGRTPPTDNGGSSEAITNFYGMAVLTGIWTFDSSGRVIGVLTESGASTNSTTNGISFRAVTRPGRMTMTGLRDGRRINYRGVPYQTLATDFSGNYYGTGKRAGRPFNEIFTLAPSSDPIFAPLSVGNLYDVSGLGSAYPFSGLALVSRQNVLALASVSFQNTNGALRSIVGPFNLSRAAGALTGVTANGNEESNVRLSIRKQ